MNHKITRKTAKLSKHLRWKATRIAAIWQTEKITTTTTTKTTTTFSTTTITTMTVPGGKPIPCDNPAWTHF